MAPKEPSKQSKASTPHRLSAGDKAPTLSLPDAQGNVVKLSDYKGKRVVVYFYPKDDTPGCTKEACQFTDLLDRFSNLGVEVLGVSPDPPERHVAFAKKHGLKVRLLSDPDHSTMERWGAWGEKTMYGKTTQGVIRSTFVIGPDQRIEHAWYQVRADGHAAKVLETVSALI